MNSEKVKEIKKALERCINDCSGNSCPYYKYEKGLKCIDDLQKDALTLINELESENERFKEKQLKAKEIMESGELSKITKQDMYYYYLTNCGYLENEIKGQKEFVSKKGKEIKQLKDRIAELENGIAKSMLGCEFLPDCTNEKLKQFAERLKEISCEMYLKEQLHWCIDETLKEFIK